MISNWISARVAEASTHQGIIVVAALSQYYSLPYL